MVTKKVLQMREQLRGMGDEAVQLEKEIDVLRDSQKGNLDLNQKGSQTFYDGFLTGIITAMILLALIIGMCHLLGYPVIIMDQ